MVLIFDIFIQDDTSKSPSTANELGLANVGGVFVVLMGGMGVACVIAVCEFLWKSRKVAVDERVSLFYLSLHHAILFILRSKITFGLFLFLGLLLNLGNKFIHWVW